MNNFSNEPKKRNGAKKAIFKTILKRYSFVVWLPILLYICNKIGIAIVDSPGTGIGMILCNTLLGFLMIVCTIIMIFTIIDGVIDFIKYLRKKTIKDDLKESICLIGEDFEEIFICIIKIPKKIWKRIKSEPERFKYSLQEEIDKQDKKE